MAKFEIKYGLGGGFGGLDGCDWEQSHATNRDDAQRDAYECAKELYLSYNGMHGLLIEEDVMEENNCDWDTAQEIVNEDIESWIDYDVREINAG